jgi:hypothetical protein
MVSELQQARRFIVKEEVRKKREINKKEKEK